MAGQGWTTVHLVQARNPVVLPARDPFPPGGGAADPATGAAAAAFGGYLHPGSEARQRQARHSPLRGNTHQRLLHDRPGHSADGVFIHRRA
jgi:predicted PhzF superfamily epimerase YddE/YHI9